MDRKCINCEFYVSKDKRDSFGKLINRGWCHRYPPVSSDNWATVDADDWCGEFVHKDKLMKFVNGKDQ